MKIIYNLTIKVDNSIASDWLAWLNNEHIKEVMATMCFMKASVLKLLETEETDGTTYVVQYLACDLAAYNSYIENFAAGMRQKSFDRWGNKFIAFRSVMEVIN